MTQIASHSSKSLLAGSTPGLLRAKARRIMSLIFGFPGAHALNALLSIVFVVVQTLIFARVLETRAFAQAIAASAIGMYLLPINQSVARANFVLLRGQAVREDDSRGLPEAAAAFHASQGLFLLVVIVAPLLMGAGDFYEYVWLAFFLASVAYSNIWYCEMQMAMLATGRAMEFELYTLVRRLVSFLVLAYLVVARDILSFSILAGVQALVFHVYFLCTAGRDAKFFAWPRGLTWPAMRLHFGRLWTSLQATFAEWITLNAPYAVFMARFGIGPGLIALDTGMKLVRINVSVTRNLCEIVLPRVSRAVFNGAGARARLEVASVLALGLAGAGVVAAAAYFVPQLTFGFLLGPNNTVPPEAGAPIALAVLASVVFATAGHLLGHTGRNVAIRIFMGVAVLTMAASSALTLFGALSVTAALWMFAASLVTIAGTGLFLLAGMLSNARQPAAKTPVS
jgi:hypothetical protein